MKKWALIVERSPAELEAGTLHTVCNDTLSFAPSLYDADLESHVAGRFTFGSEQIRVKVT
jgi:hypothetical protein